MKENVFHKTNPVGRVKINQEEIFCLIISFLGRLKSEDWCILTKEGYRQNKKQDSLIITDTTIGRIANELSVLYDVKETDIMQNPKK